MKVKVRWEKDGMSVTKVLEGEQLTLEEAWEKLSQGEDAVTAYYKDEGVDYIVPVSREEWLTGHLTFTIVEEPVLHSRMVRNHPVKLVRFKIPREYWDMGPRISNGRECPEGKTLKGYQDGDVLVVFVDHQDYQYEGDGYRRSGGGTIWSLYVVRLQDWLNEGHPPPEGFPLFVNLTPHFMRVGGVEFPPSGKVCRVVDEVVETSSNLRGFGTARCLPLEVENLPGEDDSPGTIYVVSRLVLDTIRSWGYSRDDVVAPDTGPESVVRDADGRITGTKRFLVM